MGGKWCVLGLISINATAESLPIHSFPERTFQLLLCLCSGEELRRAWRSYASRFLSVGVGILRHKARESEKNRKGGGPVLCASGLSVAGTKRSFGGSRERGGGGGSLFVGMKQKSELVQLEWYPWWEFSRDFLVNEVSFSFPFFFRLFE